ncbi:GNAT domain-containing protein [Radiomyces spectabilis]|uniref:GNAT domain-containing protein n=1 Tax=Radiomyces spectabilis TaxID=64574 RepID=UPI00221FEDA1|nr:GNAT domain-containing protein [Radiomyces spectabilis]KAI8365212.1 GNAT domain-containing protein [Radiomyces spectabilis]
MRQNENLMLIGDSVVLVPYKHEHVLQYHEWMKSPFLQEMTASEPLTLEEEYEMQQSWHEDERKCTFILLALPKDQPTKLSAMSPHDIKQTAIMIGDVNIFLNDRDDDLTFGEIEIMIAEEGYRRQGRGLEALRLMMAYASAELGLRTFHAKISLANEPSIELFKKKLAFYPVSISNAFQEITLEWSINNPPSVIGEDEEEPYGFKATPEQKTAINAMREDLISYWNTGVRKVDWE